MGDTYHNRYSKDSPYKGDKKYKKLPKKCSVCGTTKGPFDIHHTSNNRKDLKSGKGLKVMCRSCHRKYHAKLNGGKGSLDSNLSTFVSTAARIIDDPKTPESLAIAKSHKNSDLMHIELVLCHADANDNRDRWTPDDLEASAHTAINKPLNWEHKNRNIGVFYEAKYVKVSDLDDVAKAYYKGFDPLEKDFLVCKAAVWEYKYPMEARIMRERNKEGKLYFSMENNFEKAQCSTCNEVFSSVFNYCDHLLQRRQTQDTDRIFINSNIVGGAVTTIPADKLAGTLALASENNMKNFISDLIFAKALHDINIEMDIIPYIVTAGDNMKIEEKNNIPKDLLADLDDLPNEAFADSTNRTFPIDNAENIEISAKLLLNNKLDFYSKAEKLFLIEKLAKAANEYDLNISDYIENPEGGEEDMPEIDKNSAEFKQAVAEAVNEKVKELENSEQLTGLQTDKEKALAEAKQAKEEAETAKAEKAKAEKDLNEYKEKVAKEQKATARLAELAEKGYEFEDSKDFVTEFVTSATDESFASFVKVIDETASIASKKKEDDDEEDDEKSKTKKKPTKLPGGTQNVPPPKKSAPKGVVAKADKDPVAESDVAIASKVDDDSGKEAEDIIDIVFKESLDLE